MLRVISSSFVAATLVFSKCSHGMPTFFMPSENAVHGGTIMNWPTKLSIDIPNYPYYGQNVNETREEIADVVRTIAKYEPVHLFVREPRTLEDDDDEAGLAAAYDLLEDVPNVTIHLSPNVFSLWARDTSAAYVRTQDGSLVDNTWGWKDDVGVGMEHKNTSSSVVGVLLGFNQWGRKIPPAPESYFAPSSTQALNLSSVLAPFVAEAGGGFTHDGEGTMIATVSCLLNPNRNPGIDKATMEKYFADFFGIKKTIWLPGATALDITDHHVDGLARFTGVPGVVALGRPFVGLDASADAKESMGEYLQAKKVLESTTDAKGRRIKTVTLQDPDTAKVLGDNYFAFGGPYAGYVNYHAVNGAVIMSKFGDDKYDAEAAKTIGELFPGRKIEQVYTHQLAVQGGGMHCSTREFYA